MSSNGPQVQPWAIPRPRLIRAIDQAQGPLVLLRAAAGYGKTVLAAQWAAQRSGVRWLEPGDTLPGPGSWSGELVLEGYRPGDARLDQALAALLETLEPGARLFLLARAEPSLPIARWLAEGRVTLLEAEELAFDPDEATALLGRHAGEHLEQVMQRSEGWPLALRLMAQALERGGKADQVTGRLPPLSDYLEAEVWSALTPAQRRFLLRTAVLEELFPEECDGLLGRGNSARSLRALQAAGVPLRPPGRVGQGYRYPALFRDFLLSRLDETPRERRELEGRAARVLLRAFQPFRAAPHALEAQDWELALTCLSQAADRVYREGQAATLETYLQRFPEAYRERPEFLRIEAYIAWGAGNYAIALSKATRAAQSGDPDVRALALVVVAGVHQAQGRWGEEVATLEAALAARPRLPLTLGIVRHLLGAAYLRLGRLKEAEATLNQALEGFKPHQPGYASVLGQLALLHLARGRPRAAAEGLEQAALMQRRLGNLRGEAVVLYNLAIALNQAGMHRRAQGALAQARRLAEWVGLTHLLALITRESADTLRDLGEGSVELYHQALAALEALQASAGLLHAYHGLSVLHRRRGEMAAARRAAGQALRFVASGDPAFAGLVRVHRAMLEGDAQALDSALAEVLEGPNLYYQAQALLYAASRGRDPTLRRRALELIEDQGFDHLLREEEDLLALPLRAEGPSLSASTLAAGLELRMLGGLELKGPGGQPSQPPNLRPLALRLLAYLALRRGATLNPEQIAEALWPGSSEDMRPTLQTLVWQLRRALGSGIVLTYGGGYCFDPPYPVWTDVEAFGEKLRQGRLAEAVALYRGELLPGVDWAQLERQHLENRYLQALEDLAEQEAQRGNLEAAIALLERVIERDPLAEEAYQRLIAWHQQAGRPDVARRLRQEFSRALEAEFEPGRL
jgi:ATP/maltotriose-dependent transcriptional regulator MalT/DNA-binding SARP family transcriptional activator